MMLRQWISGRLQDAWRRRRDSNPRYRIYQYDGLANLGLSRAECRSSRTSFHFHAIKPCAERATGAVPRNLHRHKSRHTFLGGENELQNRRLRAERAMNAKRATSETAVTERPLGGLQPSATVHGIARQLDGQITLRRNRGQALNGREGSNEHHP